MMQRRLFLQSKEEKKSCYASILDIIERVTGFDLDGDGTVAGDIVCEVDTQQFRHLLFGFVLIQLDASEDSFVGIRRRRNWKSTGLQSLEAS